MLTEKDRARMLAKSNKPSYEDHVALVQKTAAP